MQNEFYSNRGVLRNIRLASKVHCGAVVVDFSFPFFQSIINPKNAFWIAGCEEAVESD